MAIKKWLYQEYIIKKRNLVSIAKEMGFGRYKLTDLMKKYNIKIRSNSESHKEIQKGNKNPAFIDGRTLKKYYCKICKKELSGYRRKICISCYLKSIKGINHPATIDGRTLIKHYCIDCKTAEISYTTFRYGKKRCSSCAMKELFKDPTKTPEYINGEDNEQYPLEFSDELKEKIRKRDNYKCQNCGMSEEEHLIVIGKTLPVHHIDYNKENCNENNLITLCNQCNLRANANRDYWYAYYECIKGGFYYGK